MTHYLISALVILQNFFFFFFLTYKYAGMAVFFLLAEGVFPLLASIQRMLAAPRGAVLGASKGPWHSGMRLCHEAPTPLVQLA